VYDILDVTPVATRAAAIKGAADIPARFVSDVPRPDIRQIKPRRIGRGHLFIARSALVTAASALRLLTRILIEQRLRLRRKPVSDNTMISISP
jgi:hypothetical protein